MGLNKGIGKLQATMDLEIIYKNKQMYVEKVAKNLITNNPQIDYDDLVQVGYEAMLVFVNKVRNSAKPYESFIESLDKYIKRTMINYIKNTKPLILIVTNKDNSNLEESYLREISNQDLQKILKSTLNPREYYIFMERYVFSEKKPKSYHKLGKELNISYEWVRKIEEYACEKLKKNTLMQQFNPDYKEEINLNPRVSSAIFKEQNIESPYARNCLKSEKEKLLRYEAKNQVITYFNRIYGYTIPQNDLNRIINDIWNSNFCQNFKELKIVIEQELDNYLKRRHDNIVKKRKIV